MMVNLVMALWKYQSMFSIPIAGLKVEFLPMSTITSAICEAEIANLDNLFIDAVSIISNTL